ncbi:MAG: phosphatase PAP2 family protein, partial [Gemmatimonadales bacterium]
MAFLFGAFAVLAAMVAAGWTVPLDHAVTTAAVAGRTSLLSEVAVNVTALGSAPLVALIVAIVAAYCLLTGRRRFALALAGTPLVFLVNALMKVVVGNPRPTAALVALPGSYGFPSGHSAAASALYLTLALLAAAGDPRPGARRLLVGAGLGIALLVGWSRVYLGV